MYRHPTGYLGHLKETSLEELWAKNPKKVLNFSRKRNVAQNKLRERRLKHLIINL